MTSEVLLEMRDKHPPQRSSEPGRFASLRPVAPATALEVTQEAVRKTILGFPAGSASGPCGPKAQHLKDGLVKGFQDNLLHQLALVVGMLSRGQVPREACAWVFGANLIALKRMMALVIDQLPWWEC
eukprot:3512367-Amphidinium_carterae.1